MPYAITTDFIDTFGLREANMIADRNQDGDYEAEVIDHALVTASQQIDAAVGQRCPLPLPAETPDQVIGMLRQWCLDIARYRLTGSSGVVVTDDVSERYREAKLDLDKVIGGKIFICKAGTTNANGDGGLNADNGTSGEVEYAGEPRLFTRDKLRGFHGRL